jgi:uncharacterized protein with GYD domain
VPTFVMLSTLGPDGFATLNENPHRLEAVNEEVEAPDNATMATLATRLAARGTLKTRTIATVEVADLIAALEI